MKHWDANSVRNTVGEILGGFLVFALPILLLFLGAAFDL